MMKMTTMMMVYSSTVPPKNNTLALHSSSKIQHIHSFKINLWAAKQLRSARELQYWASGIFIHAAHQQFFKIEQQLCL
jgi:hypothetical protein